MKKKKAVIIANTVYQIIVAIQLTMTKLRHMEVDLLISDHSQNVLKYVDSGKQAKIFHDIQYIESMEYARRDGKYAKSDILHEWLFIFKRFYEVKKIVNHIPDYDIMIAANFDSFTFALYDTIKFLKNKNVRFYMYEDGLSTYQSFEGRLNNNRKELIKGQFASIYKLTGYGGLVRENKGVFLFNPDMFAWRDKITKYRIPKIDKSNKEIIHILNTFFDYRHREGEFQNKKIIFFEESFYADSYKVNDIHLLNTISECVGKENILIKLHPRSRKNRFKGYDIYENSSIPWEVVYLNNDFQDIELVSISSGSIIHPFILFGDTKKMVVLQDMANISVVGADRVYQKFLKDNVFSKYPDIYCVIENEKMLKDYFCKVKGNAESE